MRQKLGRVERNGIMWDDVVVQLLADNGIREVEVETQRMRISPIFHFHPLVMGSHIIFPFYVLVKLSGLIGKSLTSLFALSDTRGTGPKPTITQLSF